MINCLKIIDLIILPSNRWLVQASSASKCVELENSGKNAWPKIRPGPSKGSFIKNYFNSKNFLF